jgi:hypothetical protein
MSHFRVFDIPRLVLCCQRMMSTRCTKRVRRFLHLLDKGAGVLGLEHNVSSLCSFARTVIEVDIYSEQFPTVLHCQL